MVSDSFGMVRATGNDKLKCIGHQTLPPRAVLLLTDGK